MKNLTPSGYVPADESMQPGYLAARMRRYKREAELKAIRDKANEMEVAAKVEQLRGKAVKHG